MGGLTYDELSYSDLIDVCEEKDARIAELEQALLDAANRASLHSSDAALLNANNDRIFKICRKALESDE